MKFPFSKRAGIALSLIISVYVFSLSLYSASAAPTPPGKKVVLVVLNNITVEDLLIAKRTNIAAVAKNGAAGVMNARAASGLQTANFYLSLGAGARANAGSYGKMGFNATERLPEQYFNGLLTAADISFQNNGVRPPKNSIVNLGINTAANHSFRYRRNIVPGLLGEMLQREGLKTAALGNADTLGFVNREITLITMDFKGKTDFGDVSRNMTRIDKTAPGGLKTDVDKLAASTLEMVSKADFTAVEFGDTSRLETQRAQMRKTRFLREHEKALDAADRFIGRLTSSLPMDRTMLIITSPQLRKDPERGLDSLVPIIVGGAGEGLLISDTTRRGGVVANMDVAPTILNYLNAPVPVEMAGSIMGSVPAPTADIFGFLNNRHSEIYAIRQLRNPFLVVYSILKMLGLIAAFIAIARARRARPLGAALVGAIQIFLLFILALPLAGFLQIPLNETNILISMGSLFAWAALPAAAAFLLLRKQPLVSLVLIAGATAMLIAADTATGAVLAERSFFGSDIVSGGRFYGVGNTLMGVLAATTIFALSGLIELARAGKKFWVWLAAALIFVVAAAVGHPRLGANVGGLITIAATALIFLHLAGDHKFTAGAVLPKLAAFVLFIPAVLRLNLPGATGVSHSDKAMAAIQEKGGSVMFDIISRKLDMNIRGTFSYNTVVALLAIGIVFGLLKVLGVERGRWLGWLGREFGTLSRGFIVIFWAALIAYAVNDTGAVAAQSILTYVAIPLVYLVLNSPPTDDLEPKLEKAPVRGVTGPRS